MPALSVWLMRTALIYLGLGFSLGAMILWHKGAPYWPGVWRLLPMHVEFVLIGWTMQLALGMAYWILPRFPREPVRGDDRPVWLAYVLLNAGVLSVGFGRWLGAETLPALGRLAEALAVGAFALHAWPRIKPPSPLA